MGNQRGSAFLENGVWIILIVFALAVAGAALALAVSGKYTELTNIIKNITVPSI
jgi:LPS O-antigen subunit length determinant protein (WzzB/FepE family)